eukprot:tig00020563_g11240.t1
MRNNTNFALCFDVKNATVTTAVAAASTQIELETDVAFVQLEARLKYDATSRSAYVGDLFQLQNSAVPFVIRRNLVDGANSLPTGLALTDSQLESLRQEFYRESPTQFTLPADYVHFINRDQAQNEGQWLMVSNIMYEQEQSPPTQPPAPHASVFSKKSASDADGDEMKPLINIDDGKAPVYGSLT